MAEEEAESVAERAAEIYDRLCDLGVASDELTEQHVASKKVEESLRATCSHIAARLPSLAAIAGIGDAGAVSSACDAVRRASASDEDAAGGRLDKALQKLAGALGAEQEEMSKNKRLDAMEMLASVAETGSLLAMRRCGGEGDQGEEEQEDTEEYERAAIATEDIGIAARVLGAKEGGTAMETLERIEEKMEEVIAEMPEGHLDFLLPEGLSEAESEALRNVDEALRREYRVRREMLIRRAEATTSSFLWSPRVESRKGELQQEVESSIARMSKEPSVNADEEVKRAKRAQVAFAARKTSTGEAGRLNSSVKSVRIGAVPDRGGRTDITRKGSMPAFQSRRPGSGRSGGKKGSGRVQGSWQGHHPRGKKWGGPSRW